VEDQCLDCYFVSDRSTDRKKIEICDHTAHPHYYSYDIVREIPKDYDCLYFNGSPKPIYIPPKLKKRGRPKKIKDNL
jgi:hypothetical protein